MEKELHKSTGRVLEVLLLLGKEQKAMTLTEISKLLSIPKSTLVPILYTMCELGFLDFNNETNKYSVGLMNYVIGKTYLSENDTLTLLDTELKSMAAKLNETCQIGILRGNQVLYIGKAEANKIRLVSDIGKLLPVYCTAIGKCLVCEFSLPELEDLLPGKLAKLTPNTITDLNVLYDQLLETRHTSIAYDFEETLEDVSCVAVAIKQHGKMAYSISVSTPSFRFTAAKKKEIIDLLLEEKGKLEFLIG
ncbi:MAG: IclR family transcriptional regulator [Enterococcaceae bacterium]|jgi:DNA-binding IclR family transcriptional regulator|nr:IclR family transcriptional regulator [Enterococcaceae bacterium]